MSIYTANSSWVSESQSRRMVQVPQTMVDELGKARERAERAEQLAQELTSSVVASSATGTPHRQQFHHRSDTADSNHESLVTSLQHTENALRAELAAERQVANDRLQDIRVLQQQLNDARKAAEAAGETRVQEQLELLRNQFRAKEEGYQRAIQEERRRADREHAVAEERLDDIRQLQSQCHAARSAQAVATDTMVTCEQLEAAKATFAQREAALAAETARERQKVERFEGQLREKAEEVRRLQSSLADMREQYMHELDKHQQELEKWQQERAQHTEREKALHANMKAREEAHKRDLSVAVSSCHEREETLRQRAGKEWQVAEERLEEIRGLQKQISTLTVKLSEASQRAAEEREALAILHSQEQGQIKAVARQQIEALQRQLEEERDESSKRLSTIQALERQVANLGEQLSHIPQGLEARDRVNLKQLELALAAHRADADDAARRNRQREAELEKQVQAERCIAEERLADIRAAQKLAAEARTEHAAEMDSMRQQLELALGNSKMSEEATVARWREREESLKRRLENEKQCSNERLHELRAMQRKMQELHNSHTAELASQHNIREQLVGEMQEKEEAHRRAMDQARVERETALADKEKEHLEARERALLTARKEGAEREATLRREAEERIRALQARAKEEAEARYADEQRRIKDMEAFYTKQIDEAKKHEQQAVATAEAAADSAAAMQRQMEAMRLSAQQDRQEIERRYQDEIKRLQSVTKEADDKVATKGNEMAVLRKDADMQRSRAAVAEAEAADLRAQLSGLESEMARQSEQLVMQRDAVESGKMEIQARIAQERELRLEIERLHQEINSRSKVLDQHRPEMARLAADNCRLVAENAKLADREARLRSWAQQAAVGGCQLQAAT